jgi:bacteriocin biosynthesis cyclodehydratase domain-containing protein
MAATVLIAEPGELAATALGDFGREVVRLLAEQFPAAGAPAAKIVAAWRPDWQLFEAEDEAAFRRGYSWLPVVLEHPHIRVGPLIVPGASGCHRCYQARRVQHDEHPELTQAIDAAYARDQELGPAGYLPHHVRLAAAIARRHAAGTGQSGRVTVVNILTGRFSTHSLVPCHNCPRCAASLRDGAGQDLFAHLRSLLTVEGGGSA